MYTRKLEPIIEKAIKKYDVILINGPRQSGKTTLARKVFPGYKYVLLEELDLARFATEDPRGFFESYSGNVILDEVQKVPALFSYIQGIVDSPNNKRKFILSGSENLKITEKISQSLAGRVKIFTLLPFSKKEFSKESLIQTLFYGSYPRIHDKELEPRDWLSSYYSSYVQKDVREIINVGDLEQFDRFVRLVAARVGQLSDYSGISSDCGISQPTAKKWFSILQATFVCFKLEPHFKNFNKRIIKSPKLFFYDTGLLCYLLRIKNTDQLISNPLYGSIFENWVIAEKIKDSYNQGEEHSYYFWRDTKQREVDIVEDRGGYLFPIEVKSSKTFHSTFFKTVDYLNSLQAEYLGKEKSEGNCIYGGDKSFEFKNKQVLSWKDL